MAWPAGYDHRDRPSGALGSGQSPACPGQADALYNPALMTTLNPAVRASSGPASSATSATQDRRRVLLISGLAGAGRTTALRALEDLGYEAVDNLPLELLPHLVSGIASGDSEGPIAIGIDSRSRGFSAAEFLARIESLRADLRFELVLVFLDCTDDVLIRRFTETRRRHPLAPDRNAADGLARERSSEERRVGQA